MGRARVERGKVHSSIRTGSDVGLTTWRDGGGGGKEEGKEGEGEGGEGDEHAELTRHWSEEEERVYARWQIKESTWQTRGDIDIGPDWLGGGTGEGDPSTLISLLLSVLNVSRILFLLLPVRHDRRRGGLGRLLQGRLSPRPHRRHLFRRPLHRRPQARLGSLFHCLARQGCKVCSHPSFSPPPNPPTPQG